MTKRTFTKYPQGYIKSSNEIPEDYVYDCENDRFTVYRNKYTGDEIHVDKPVDYLDEEACKDLAVDVFLKHKNGQDFISIASDLNISVNDAKRLYNSIGAGCNIQFIVYPNDTTNGTIGRTGQIYTPGEN